MKSLFVTILIFGGAFLAYDYFLAPPGEKVVFKSLNTVAPVVPTIPEPSKAEPKPETKPVAATSAPKPAMPVTPTPGTTTPAPSTAAPVADASGFVTPKFDTLDVLSKGWTMIPKSAFPRQVKLTKNTPFKMSVGASMMNAGATVTALGFENGLLVLAPNESSSARASAPVDDTDLKAVIQVGYEQWKLDRIAAARRAFESRKVRGNAPLAAVDPSTMDAGGKPTRGSDGTYTVLVNSIKSGDITEIKLANIHRYEEAQPIMVEGKPGWSIKVECDVETVFGLQPAQAQAIVRDGRVKGWFYTGSGEPVP